MRKGWKSQHYLAWKEKVQLDLIPMYKYLMRRNEGEGILPIDRMWGNGHKSKPVKFHLSTKKSPTFELWACSNGGRYCAELLPNSIFKARTWLCFQYCPCQQIQNKALHELLWRILTLSQPNQHSMLIQCLFVTLFAICSIWIAYMYNYYEFFIPDLI